MAQTTLVLTRLLHAPIERVFAACSKPELFSRWLICCDNNSGTATATATNTLQVGGHYRVEMARDGQVFARIDGEYLAIAAPHHLVFTWRSENVSVQNSVVRIDLLDTGAGTTELRLSHAIDPDSHDGKRFTQGWTQALANLLKLMEVIP
ncbi:MAG: SRPBCC domain-containing protein [Pseudomonadota bacterium]